jgi:hypothetical protein
LLDWILNLLRATTNSRPKVANFKAKSPKSEKIQMNEPSKKRELSQEKFKEFERFQNGHYPTWSPDAAGQQRDSKSESAGRKHTWRSEKDAVQIYPER